MVSSHQSHGRLELDGGPRASGGQGGSESQKAEGYFVFVIATTEQRVDIHRQNNERVHKTYDIAIPPP